MIIIKNKDYSVLEIGILDSMKNECLILIHLTNATKKYIIAELKHYRFDIKF